MSHPKPSISERAAEKVCPECGGPVARTSTRGRAPTFCCTEHKIAFRNRLTAQGSALAGLIKAWRIDRGSGDIAKAAFAEICAIADHFNAEDRSAARPRADLYAAKLLADGRLYMDRMAR